MVKLGTLYIAPDGWDTTYRIVGRLGVGGFGEVWAAQCLEKPVPGGPHRGPIALKFMRENVVGGLPAELEAQLVKRFKRESTNALEFDHPNVLAPLFVKHDVITGEISYAMPLSTEGDLRKCLSGIGDTKKSGLVLGIAEGLSYLHNLGVVHRDLKPANVLMFNGVPMVTDFGLAKWDEHFLSTNAQSMTGTGVGMGTFAYMAPEQRTSAKTVDAAADLWAFGLMLFEIHAGTKLTTDQVLVAPPRTYEELLDKARPHQGMGSLFSALTAIDPSSRVRLDAFIAAYKRLLESEARLDRYLLDNSPDRIGNLVDEVCRHCRGACVWYNAGPGGYQRPRQEPVCIDCGATDHPVSYGWF